MWAIAGSIAALGENDVAARVPSLVAGLLTMLVVAAAARRLSFASERVERSRFAFVVLGTMPGFLLQAYVDGSAYASSSAVRSTSATALRRKKRLLASAAVEDVFGPSATARELEMEKEFKK